jgi:hypothetical protein
MKVHIVEHVPFEGPGLILKWAEDRKAAIGFTRLYNDEAFLRSDPLTCWF